MTDRKLDDLVLDGVSDTIDPTTKDGGVVIEEVETSFASDIKNDVVEGIVCSKLVDTLSDADKADNKVFDSDNGDVGSTTDDNNNDIDFVFTSEDKGSDFVSFDDTDNFDSSVITDAGIELFMNVAKENLVWEISEIKMAVVLSMLVTDVILTMDVETPGVFTLVESKTAGPLDMKDIMLSVVLDMFCVGRVARTESISSLDVTENGDDNGNPENDVVDLNSPTDVLKTTLVLPVTLYIE